MRHIINTTIVGILRDKVLHGIMALAIVFLLIPIASTLSMRQVSELSITLSLSLISLILMVLSLFLGSISIWRDIEKRYVFSVISLPISRRSYLLGRFFGIAIFILITATLLGVVAGGVIWFTSASTPPERPLVWENVWVAILFDSFKYILLIAFALLLSTISTSFFLPIFGSIALFLVGNASQQVYEYINSPSATKALSTTLIKIATALYYVLPNFSAFNLKINAIYGIPLKLEGLALTFGYFIIYCTIVLVFASILFSSREMK